MRSLLTAAVTVVAALPGVALAQPPDPPRVELGGQVSVQTGQSLAATWSPRMTLNLTPRTAGEVSADVRPGRTDSFGTRISSRAYTAHWRQTLFTAGRWQFSGVLGVGVSRQVTEFPAQVIGGRDGPEVFPAHTFVDEGLAVQLGPVVQVEVARRLALRGDLRLTAGDHGGLRAMVGAVVPVGAFRAGDRPGLSRQTPALAAWQRVKPGREVWVTTASGALVHGEVTAVSGGSLGLRQRRGDVAVPLDEIRLVEGPDSLKNGILIGAATGALSGGALFTWAANVLCESDPCAPFAVIAFLYGAGSGAAVGGLLGAMVDGLVPGRRTLFEKSGVRLVPVVTPSGRGVYMTVAWR